MASQENPAKSAANSKGRGKKLKEICQGSTSTFWSIIEQHFRNNGNLWRKVLTCLLHKIRRTAKKDTFHTKNMIVEPNEAGEVQNQGNQKTKVLPANHSPCKSLNLQIVIFENFKLTVFLEHFLMISIHSEQEPSVTTSPCSHRTPLIDFFLVFSGGMKWEHWRGMG